MLSRDASYPSVLGQLRHLIGMRDTRFDESFGGFTPRVEVVRKETGNELDDPGISDLSVHAPPREPSRNDDTGDGIGAMVTQNISGDDGYLVIIIKKKKKSRG